MADERAVAERLITYDSSREDQLRSLAGFVKGWLEARDVPVQEEIIGGLPVLSAEVGRGDGPTVLLHAHLDVVPGREEQFRPVVEGDRLIGRGAYDMKGGLAAMLCAMQDLAELANTRVQLLIVSDEESEEVAAHATDELIAAGRIAADFAI